jgi:hypothetical protein
MIYHQQDITNTNAPMMSNTMASSSDNPNSIASSSATQVSPLTTFHPFPRLPQEIKDMIWKESVAEHPRVIVITHCRFHGDNDGTLVSRIKNISEEIPALLITCSASRKVMLKLVDKMYHSVFDAPKLGRMKYHYIGDLSHGAIFRNARALVPDLFRQRCSGPTGYMLAINQQLNRRAHATVPPYAALLARESGSLFPAYFNPVLDTLYIRGAGTRSSNDGPYFVPGLWAPTQRHKAHQIQNLAVELDRRIPLHTPHHNQVRVWTNTASFKLCTNLETLYIVCLEDKEVIQFSFNESNTLARGQWIYSLETGSKMFKDEMGDDWTGVLWKIELKESGYLWGCARHWHCAAVKWEKEKRSVCKNNDEVPDEWFDAERVRGFRGKDQFAIGVKRKGKIVEGVKYPARGEGWYSGNF